MLNGYEICLSTTNSPIFNIQDVRYWLSRWLGSVPPFSTVLAEANYTSPISASYLCQAVLLYMNTLYMRD